MRLGLNVLVPRLLLLCFKIGVVRVILHNHLFKTKAPQHNSPEYLKMVKTPVQMNRKVYIFDRAKPFAIMWFLHAALTLEVVCFKSIIKYYIKH